MSKHDIFLCFGCTLPKMIFFLFLSNILKHTPPTHSQNVTRLGMGIMKQKGKVVKWSTFSHVTIGTNLCFLTKTLRFDAEYF